jgi:hypothetical protein
MSAGDCHGYVAEIQRWYHPKLLFFALAKNWRRQPKFATPHL